jgi:hypothetical protein
VKTDDMASPQSLTGLADGLEVGVPLFLRLRASRFGVTGRALALKAEKIRPVARVSRRWVPRDAL